MSNTTYQSIVVNKPIAEVWQAVRNFHDGSFAPHVIETLEPVGDKAGTQIGAQRKLNGVFVETLIELSDYSHTLRYSINSAPGTPADGASNYIGTLNLMEVTTDDSTFVEWFSSWDEGPQEVGEFCTGIYNALLGDLKKTLEG